MSKAETWQIVQAAVSAAKGSLSAEQATYLTQDRKRSILFDRIMGQLRGR